MQILWYYITNYQPHYKLYIMPNNYQSSLVLVYLKKIF